MRYRLMALSLVFIILTAASAASAGDEAAEYVPGEMIVKFKPSVGEKVEEALGTGEGFSRAARLPAAASLDELNRRFGVREPKPLCPMMRLKGRKLRQASAGFRGRLEKARAQKPGLANIFKVKVTDTGRDLKRICAEYARDPNVEYAEPNYIVHANATPNDPRFNELWGMHNTGQTGGTADADIDAPEAWDSQTGSRDAVVAVIDTGVDYNHEDLAANMWTNPGEIAGNGIDDDGNGYVDDVYGYDFHNGDGDPWDDHYHGTHVAGTIGGVGNNGVGVAGVCWQVKIMAVKFLSSGGSGTTANAISSVNYATLMGADLSSNSWGGGGFSQGLKDAIDAAGAAGALFIAAAGNSGSNNDTSPQYPASYDSENIISVAATDHDDGLASFSCWGPTSVDVGAPGVSILSSRPNNTYGLLSGTSMATPHVSGLAALIISHDPYLTYLEVKQVIMDTVDPIPALSGKVVTGGRINAYSAIAALVSSQGRVDLDRDAYSLSDTITITVRDTDLDTNPSAPDSTTVQIASSPTGDSETVALTETGATTKTFRNTISIAVGAPAPGDGDLQAADGDTLTATYHDEDDGTGNPADVQDTATADGSPPVISNVQSVPSATSCTITWMTNEPGDSLVRSGEGTPPSTETADSTLTTSHSLRIRGLNPLTAYYFEVASSDSVGNTTTDNNGGSYYQFTTLERGAILFVDDDEGDPYESYFTSALNAHSYGYDEWDVDVDGSPAFGNLDDYQIVIWNCGFEWGNSTSGLTTAEETALSEYMDSGGSVFLCGQDVIYNGVSSGFRTNYLHLANYYSDDTTTEANGIAGDRISDGMSLPLNYPFTNWSDSLNPDSSSSGAFLTDGVPVQPYCATRYPADGISGSFRIVFLAFPFEAISSTAADPSNAMTVMDRVVQFLAQIEVDEISPTYGLNDRQTAVTIVGSGFKAGPTVTIGGVSLTDISATATEISATVPAGIDAGLYDLVVRNSDSLRAVLSGAFTALDPAADDDQDGLTNEAEVVTHGTNPLLADTDEDLLSDGDEVGYGTNPLDPDPDGDGLTDYEEVNYNDTDGGYNPYDPAANPTGTDTDVNKADTDGDGYSDMLEVSCGSNPLDPLDVPGNVFISFQPPGAARASGYSPDIGVNYGGRGYGWR